MFCQKCGKELNENNVCESCYPSHNNNIKNNHKTNNNNSSKPKVTFNDLFNQTDSNDEILKPKKKVKFNTNPNNKSNTKPNNKSNTKQNDKSNTKSSDESSDESSDKNYDNELRDVNNLSSKEFLSFIGDKNSEYFVKKWTKSQKNKNFLSLNLSALFANFFWFWYRKMYGMSIIIFLLTSILSLLTACFAIVIVAPIASDFSPYITEHKWITLLICLFVPLGISLNANQLYIKYVIKKINKIKLKKSAQLDNDALLKRLHLAGGTTMAPLFFIIVVLLILLIYILIVIEPSILVKFMNYVLKFVRKLF